METLDSCPMCYSIIVFFRSNKIVTNGDSGPPTTDTSPTSGNSNSGSEEKKKLEHVQTYRYGLRYLEEVLLAIIHVW